MGVTSAQNYVGIAEVMDELIPLLEEYGCELWHLGHEKGNPPLAKWIPKSSTVPLRSVPWTAVKHLPWLLSEIDVGVIARRKHVFHEGQSNVSGLSYAAAGVPFVVSHTEEYALLEAEGAGRTFTHPHLTEALAPILASVELRHEMRTRGREVALFNHNPITVAKHYEAAFEECRAATAH
jgi:hypothetical protein